MATSERTKSLKRKRNFFATLSFALWIGTVLFLAIYAFALIGANPKEGGIEILSPEAKDILIGLGTTGIIGIIGVIIIKDKIRIFIWMCSLIMSVVLFKEVGMYVILGIWFVDEYILHNLYKYFAKRVTINKEIDLRDE